MGDLSGTHSLLEIRWKMMMEDEGRLILKERPRIWSEFEDTKALSELAPHTFGFQYFHYLEQHNFHSDERPIAKYISDIELAYVY